MKAQAGSAFESYSRNVGWHSILRNYHKRHKMVYLIQFIEHDIFGISRNACFFSEFAFPNEAPSLKSLSYELF